MSPWRSVPEQSAILLVDAQEKLLPAIHGYQDLVKRISLLCQSAGTLSVPIYVSEQVPEKLGATITEILQHITPARSFSKTRFSAAEMVDSENAVKHWILCGIEAHICVRQTALGIQATGKRVSVLADAVSSRHSLDHRTALDEMRDSGIRIMTVESLLFEWLENSEHPHFKTISKLVKDC